MSDFKMPDLGGLMEAAKKMQGDMQKMQEELARQECEASSGGGMVTARMNGHYELVSLKIDKAVAGAEDLEMLQDLIVAAVNQTVVKVRDTTQAEMAKVTGGLPIPGMVP